jgi:hypothetical protein
MTIYSKPCPGCGKPMVYDGKHGKYHLKESIEKGRKCNSCSQIGKVLSDETKKKISDNNALRGKPNLFSRKLPYEWLLTRVKWQAKHRGISVEFDYEQFLSFMNRPCEYCGTVIIQSPYHHSKTKSYAWALDRKDNKGPYSVGNCVPSCFRCNRIKGREFSYEQMRLIGNVIRTFNDVEH